jgi:putative transposase
VIVEYIDSQRGVHGVEPICAVLAEAGVQIAPSTCWARKVTPVTDAELEEAYLVNALVTIWRANWGVYGNLGLRHDLGVYLRPRVLAGQASSLCDGHGSTP